jgi:hypothetical protein
MKQEEVEGFCEVFEKVSKERKLVKLVKDVVIK